MGSIRRFDFRKGVFILLVKSHHRKESPVLEERHKFTDWLSSLISRFSLESVSKQDECTIASGTHFSSWLLKTRYYESINCYTRIAFRGRGAVSIPHLPLSFPEQSSDTSVTTEPTNPLSSTASTDDYVQLLTLTAREVCSSSPPEFAGIDDFRWCLHCWPREGHR